MSKGAALTAAAAVSLGIATVVLVWKRARKRRRVIARYTSTVTGRPWYREIVVTDQITSAGNVRALHLGHEANEPESQFLLCNGHVVAADALRFKPHLQYSLLAFGWHASGFADSSRAALIGVAGGALLHFWASCVPGGEHLRVDAVELDAAMVGAARAHLGLSALEPPHGQTTLHVADGAAWLREAEDESYDLLVVDLDMGALLPNEDEQAGGSSSGVCGAGHGCSTSSDSGNGSQRKRVARSKSDPVRDMYRVLSSRGVLVVNEYREDTPSERLKASLRLVRSLRRFFPQVHVVRTTTHHNVMMFAPVERAPGCDDAPALAARASKMHLGGIDIHALVAALPANRHQVYDAHDT